MKFAYLDRILSEKSFSSLVDQLSTAFGKKISFDDNIACQVVTIENIGAGVEFSIPHSFKAVPKYRIIGRQRGGGAVIDGDTPWTDRVVYLKNTGSTAIDTVTVIVVRD